MQNDPLTNAAFDNAMNVEAPRRQFIQSALAATAAGLLSSSESSSAERGHTMQDAIKSCLDCHAMCLRIAMTDCLQRGGAHVRAEHFRLMINCAELCQTSANFMLSSSPLHGRVCAVCAEACDACARSCEQVGGMEQCIEACRECAKSCRSMAAM
jgi:hypothetical protein